MVGDVARGSLALLLVGCIVINPDFEGAQGSSGSTLTTSPATTNLTTTSTSRPVTTGGGEGASDGAAAAGSDATGGTWTSAGSTSVDPTTEAPAPAEHLQHYVGANCQYPLWCLANVFDVSTGIPGRVWAQECFTAATTAPPLQIRGVGFVLAQVIGAPASPAIEVYLHDGQGPAQLVEARPIDPGILAAPGHNQVALEPPILVPSASFCVGLVGGDPDVSSLGVAVDVPSIAPDRSFLKLDSVWECDSQQWLDVDDINPNPEGAWCIDVDVEAAG